jgi:uncharacterized repeat protein (TIGR01451 family)
VTPPVTPPVVPPAASNPAIGITKNPKSQTLDTGGTAVWTIVVTNTGNVTLTNVRVTDPEAPNCSKTSADIAALASMAPGASVTYQCSRAKVLTSFTNVATDTGTPPTGADVSATDSAKVNVTPPFKPPVKQTHPAIRIVKDPKLQNIGSGGTATFKITVTNNGDVTLHDVTVTDPQSPDCNHDLGTMTVGQSKDYMCTKPQVFAAYTNVANVVGTAPNGQKVSDQDNAKVTLAPFTPPVAPKIQIVKNPKLQTVDVKSVEHGGKVHITKGGTANFKMTVTNTGNTPLHDVTVTDPRSPGCNHSLGSMGQGTSKNYSCSQPNVKAGYTNVANVVGTSPQGQKVHDSDTAQVNIKTKPVVTG